MGKEPIRLSANFEELFPGDMFTVGSQEIEINPLGIAKLASVARRLTGFGKALTEEGITWDNFQEPSKLITLTVVLLEKAPDVVADSSNIHIDDINRLPLELAVELVSTVLDVNLRSKETLIKNFESLATKLNLTQVVVEPEPEKTVSRKLSKR